MVTEAKVSDIPEIVETEADNRAQVVASAAAAQIDQATKDAEAIARAAQQTELGAHISRVESEGATWRAQMETRLTEQAAAAEAKAEALKASILEAISTQQLTPPVVEAPVVEAASVSDEPAPNSKQTDTTPETTPKPQRKGFLPSLRLRKVL